MKRAVVGLVAAALAAGSVMTAAPASAEPGDPVACMSLLPELEQHVITIDGLDVIIDPNAIGVDPDDVIPLVDDILWYVLCVEGGTISPTVFCRYNITWAHIFSIDPTTGNFRYITRDATTGVITIRGSQLVADANACL